MTHSEHQAAHHIAKEEPGALVIKMTATGNPDFIVIPKELASYIRFVEVKSGSDTVQPHQQSVHENLRREGFRVEVVRVQNGSVTADELCDFSLVPPPIKDPRTYLYVRRLRKYLSNLEPSGVASWVRTGRAPDASAERRTPSVISNETAVAL